MIWLFPATNVLLGEGLVVHNLEFLLATNASYRQACIIAFTSEIIPRLVYTMDADLLPSQLNSSPRCPRIPAPRDCPYQVALRPRHAVSRTTG